ncbi:SH3 domain-containing protein [Massilia sp. METH4]|uniref:SH3 domain-containing protein n=1 Tax=Massilia sp. METH4 TaxID=3123041 RepID=UPI0030CFDEE5
MTLPTLADHHGALAYALGLALTLVLAAFLTPERWWRRPTARGLAILGGGAWACGALLLHAAGTPAAQAEDMRTASMQADVPAQHPSAHLPVAGQRYRVHRDLNVRNAAGVGSARQAVVPAGSYVIPTGEHAGDWWRIRYDGPGAGSVGWASSLWLRRAAE